MSGDHAEQCVLFDVPAAEIDCARGCHGHLVDLEPDIRELHVNVARACEACGRLVSLTSWTREAWDTRKVKS